MAPSFLCGLQSIISRIDLSSDENLKRGCAYGVNMASLFHREDHH